MSIDEKWLPTVDQVVSTAIAGKKRIIGVTSPDGSVGVTMLSKILAESFSLARVKTLLIDFSGAKQSDHQGGDGWIPVLKEPSGFLQKHPKGYDLLESRPDQQNRFIFNNTDKLREVLDRQLADYETIILDLPPIHAQNTGINAISCAATCDLAYLMCLTGHVNSGDLKDVKESTRSCQCAVSRGHIE